MLKKAPTLWLEMAATVSKYATIQTFAVACVCFVVYYITRLATRHRYFSRLPGPPHSFWTGHLAALAKATKNSPARCHPHCMFSEMVRLYNLSGVAYIDLWPMRSEPMMLILDPEYAAQAVMSDVPLHKHPTLGEFLHDIAGSDNILINEGARWKSMRGVFNPGFSSANLMKLVPAMIEEGKVFVEVLDAVSKTNKPVPIDELCTKVTVDIIGRAVLNSKFRSQTEYNELVDSFLKVLSHQGDNSGMIDFWNKFQWRRIIRLAYYKRRLDKIVEAVVADKLKDEQLYAKIQDGKEIKHVIGLAVKEQKIINDKEVNPEFFRALCDNIRIFLFAGHDTTSSVLSFSFYLLSEHPEILQSVRQEHDDVFGHDPDLAADLISEHPILLNKLPLTLAIIKEVLRLYPPASTVRKGNSSVFINTTDGPCPTVGTLTWVIAHAVHRNPKHYPSPNLFIPERWLPSSPFPQIPADAFRPFERGPRNCIGQDLAMLESRLVLALVLRKFGFESAFGNGKGSWAIEVEPSGAKRYPEGASQVLVVSAKPKDGLPLRVSRR